MGISEATFFRWKQKFSGPGPSELRWLRQLEEEDAKLKRLVGDLSLGKAMLQEVLAKKVDAWSAVGACPLRAGGVQGSERRGCSPCGFLAPPSATDHAATIRRPCGCGSARSRRRGCAMATRGSTCRCNGRAGR
jgi:hypothetical protein